MRGVPQQVKPQPMDSTPNLQLPYLMGAVPEARHPQRGAADTRSRRAALVLDKDLASPPGCPADGSRYIVAASPTGAWAGHAAHVAAWQDGAWVFYTPREGWLAWVADEDQIYAYSGSAWVAFTAAGTGVSLWGINATADTTNRLGRPQRGIAARQRRRRSSAEDQQGGRRRHRQHTLPDGLLGPRRVRPDRRRRLPRQGEPGRSSWHEALVVDKDDGTADLEKLRAQDYLIGTQATGPRFVAVGDSHTVGTGATAPTRA